MDRHSTPGVSAVTCGLSCSGALLFEEILIAAQEWLLMDFEGRAVHQVWLGTTHPPCFCQRVRNCLKRKGLVKIAAGKNHRGRILRLSMLAPREARGRQDAHPWPDAQCASAA